MNRSHRYFQETHTDRQSEYDFLLTPPVERAHNHSKTVVDIRLRPGPLLPPGGSV